MYGFESHSNMSLERHRMPVQLSKEERAQSFRTASVEVAYGGLKIQIRAKILPWYPYCCVWFLLLPESNK